MSEDSGQLPILSAMRLSDQIEAALVEKNLRGMAHVRGQMLPGYLLRAALMLCNVRGTVLITTGFPVHDTFETDGPVGAITLYQALQRLGANPVIVCGPDLARALESDFTVEQICCGEVLESLRYHQAQMLLDKHAPELMVSIESPGRAADQHCYNMRGVPITDRVAAFDELLTLAQCPTIAIGDGGNELGMGNVSRALQSLDINAAVSRCTELLVADVSNWGGHALVALIGWINRIDLLASFDNHSWLSYLAERGSVDGVTGEKRLTEDGLCAAEGQAFIDRLRLLTGFAATGDQNLRLRAKRSVE